MSDIYPDQNIVDEINSNRGSSAEQKIQFRIMKSLELIAKDLNEYMHPPVPQPSEPPSTSAVEVSNEITSLLQTAHEVGEGRRRRRQESA